MALTCLEVQLALLVFNIWGQGPLTPRALSCLEVWWVHPCSVFWRRDARQWQWPGDYDTEWWTRTGSVMGAADGWGYKWWQP